MTNFLFWNIGRKRLDAHVVALALEHEVDVLVLAESEIPPATALMLLNADVTQYHFPFSLCDKVSIYTRFPASFIQPLFESRRWTMRRVMLPGQTQILLAAVHMTDKRAWSEQDQVSECHELSAEIRRVEEQVGHSRTVLVGDLNMNPFEHGMVAANGLHAVSARQVASRQSRTVQDREYPFFYNPMWSLLGDATPGPPGTLYYPHSGHVSHFWNMFDQVLIRPDLMPLFRSPDLEILSSVGGTSLLNRNGIPSATVGSDHLPILFKLSL